MPKPKSKVKKCQYLIAGAMLLGLIFMQNAAFAVTFDLQPYTSCGSANSTHAFCYTALDVSVLGLATNKINALKGVNITNFLNKQGTFYNMGYSWTGNTLNVSGYILKGTNNYYDWTAGGDTFHPWWNYTITNETNYTWVGSDTVNLDGGTTPVVCYRYRGNTTQGIFKVGKPAIEGSNFVEVYDTEGGNLTSIGVVGNYSGGVAVGTSIPILQANRNYSICNIQYGGAHTYHKAGTVSPADTPYGVINDRCYSLGYPISWVCDKNYIMGIQNITLTAYSTANFSTWYVNTLTLNGTAANLTMANSTALNVTTTTNLTGTPVLAWRNGTIIINTTNSGTNTSSLAEGLYNITAFFGNTSTNETITWWANMTYTPPAVFVYNYTYTICTDNSTLLWHYARFLNGTFNYTDTYELCLNGCDNTTFSCSPPTYYGYGITIVIIVIIFIGLLRLRRWY